MSRQIKSVAREERKGVSLSKTQSKTMHRVTHF